MDFIDVAIGVFVGALALHLVANYDRLGRDDTDSAHFVSGLTVYTDARTKVQYLGTLQGGLSVRVDADGHPIIKKD